MLKSRVQPDIVSYNAVINSHAKAVDPCGAAHWLEAAAEVQLSPNIISYNTVVGAHAKVGDADAVADVLDQMAVAGLEPTVVTWTSMLSACANARPRRTEAAERVFRMMLQRGIAPNKVTLSTLGRA